MDVDTLNSPTEEQMEMMIMMMQMDKKLPSEFSPPHPDSITHHSFHSPHLISPSQTLLNPPPHPLSFLSYNTIHHTHHLLLQEPILPPSTTLSTSPAMADENKLTHHNNISSDHFSSATTAFPSYPLSNNKRTSMASMREMIFRIAAMQPIHIDPESIKPPKRRNVKISKDPLSVAARHRREKISERIRILQRLVPRGTKMDTASLLDEAIHYVKFLKTQVQSLERASANSSTTSIGLTRSINGFTAGICNADFGSLEKTYNCFPAHHQMFSPTQMLN